MTPSFIHPLREEVKKKKKVPGAKSGPPPVFVKLMSFERVYIFFNGCKKSKEQNFVTWENSMKFKFQYP
jgi:hypothetical protein